MLIQSLDGCNTPFTLSSTSSGGYPDYSYQWFLLPNATSISNTSGLSSTTPASEGNYAIQVVISDSCGYQRSDIQIINVLPPCQVEIPNVLTSKMKILQMIILKSKTSNITRIEV